MEPLDLIDRTDYCSMLVLVALTLAIGTKVIGESPLRVWGYRISVGAFVVYGAVDALTHEPATGWAWILVVIDSLIVCGLALGTSWIALAIGGTIFHFMVRLPSERYQSRRASVLADRRVREMEAERERLEAERLAAERMRRQELQAVVTPPPPTREELAEAARKRFEAALRLLDTAGLDEIELNTARLRAKQLYLRELDRVMQ